ncbi:MAG: murein biosynthesis integral membrane protein MurJ [Patescibacteria group bacterium]
MIKRIFSGQSKTITSAAVIIGVASLASGVLGMLRDRILAGEFGAGRTLDIYYAAFRIPDLIYNLLVLGALSAGFIPVFISYYKNQEQDEWRLTSGVLNIIVLSLLVLCGILFFLSPWLVPLTVPGFDEASKSLTVQLTQIMLLSPIFLGISAIWGGILQSLKKFFVYSFAPIFYNIGIMVGALFFVRWWGVAGLAWGVVLGAFLHMIVQLPLVISSGFKYHWLFNWREAGIREILFLMIPRTLGLAISQVNLLVINIIGSTLLTGSIAIFNLANNLQSFPLGVFGISFAIAAFPTLSTFIASGDKDNFVKSFSQTVRQILFFIIPLSVMFLVLRAQIVRVILGAGYFDWEDTILTADALALFSISLFAQSLIPLLARGFYALHNTLIPFVTGLVGAVVNIVLALSLAKVYGVAGLALAFSVSSIINMALLWIFLRFKVGRLDEANIIWSVAKISVATIAMALVIQFLKYFVEPFTGTRTFLGILAQGGLAAFGGLIVFVLVSLLLKSEEMLLFITSLRRRFFRKEEVPKLEEEL